MRVEEIALDKSVTYRVEKIALFGSALRNDLSDYGDVDFGYSVSHKPQYPDVKSVLLAQQEITRIPFIDLKTGHPEAIIERRLRDRSHSFTSSL